MFTRCGKRPRMNMKAATRVIKLRMVSSITAKVSIKSSSRDYDWFQISFPGEKFILNNKPFIKRPNPAANRIQIQAVGRIVEESRGI